MGVARKFNHLERKAKPKRRQPPEEISKPLNTRWYELELEQIPDSDTLTELTTTLMSKCEKAWLEEFCSERKVGFLDEISHRGTRLDRIAALVVRVSDDVLGRGLESFERLVSMMENAKTREVFAALDPLLELLLDYLLPNNRKLKALSPSYLLQSQLSALRRRCVDFCERLLRSTPENENRLLSMIVNKLGDTDAVVSSTSLSAIQRLLKHHPRMSQVVFREVESFVFRSNLPERAQFYGLTLMTSIPCSDRNLASEMINAFMSVFNRLGNLIEEDRRVVKTVLKGVRKSIAYVDDLTMLDDARIKDIFRLAYNSTNTSIALDALSLLFTLTMKQSGIANERNLRKSAHAGMVDVGNGCMDEENEAVKTSWVHCDLNNQLKKQYDPTARNPAYAGVPGFYELVLLKDHYHPTVSLFAQQILNSEPITYKSDPFVDFAPINFLDAFSFKKPKKNRGEGGNRQGVHYEFLRKYLRERDTTFKEEEVTRKFKSEEEEIDYLFDQYLSNHGIPTKGDITNIDFAGALKKGRRNRRKSFVE
ncbi:hypothetical protein ACOME3_005457 [Neoechinorhynchus agilis]